MILDCCYSGTAGASRSDIQTANELLAASSRDHVSHFGRDSYSKVLARRLEATYTAPLNAQKLHDEMSKLYSSRKAATALKSAPFHDWTQNSNRRSILLKPFTLGKHKPIAPDQSKQRVFLELKLGHLQDTHKLAKELQSWTTNGTVPLSVSYLRFHTREQLLRRP